MTDILRRRCRAACRLQLHTRIVMGVVGAISFLSMLLLFLLPMWNAMPRPFWLGRPGGPSRSARGCRRCCVQRLFGRGRRRFRASTQPVKDTGGRGRFAPADRYRLSGFGRLPGSAVHVPPRLLAPRRPQTFALS